VQAAGCHAGRFESGKLPEPSASREKHPHSFEQEKEFGTMLVNGFLSFLQMTCIPGFICLKLAGWKEHSGLQRWVYAFAASLIVNFCLVYALVALELHGRPAMAVVLGLEAGAGLLFLKRGRFRLESRLELSEWAQRYVASFRLNQAAGCIVFVLAAAAFLSYGHLLAENLNSVFTLWDDTVSWDRWAEEWVANQFPTNAGYYPQLVPANWSITYAMTGNTDIKMFAKWLMPLFPLATFLLFLDLALRRRSVGYLLSIAVYGAILYSLLGSPLIVSGYMETALPFFACLTVYALLEFSEETTPANALIVSVFAGGTALVKQGGLFIVVLAAVWMGVVFYRRRSGLSGRGKLPRLTVAASAGLVVLLPWYIRQYLSIASGKDASNIAYLAGLAAGGRDRSDVITGAFMKLYGNRGEFGHPFCWFLVVTIVLSVWHRLGRRVLAYVLAPLLLLWAAFFSYEVRTASVAFPFAAFCSGAGFGRLLSWTRLISSRFYGEFGRFGVGQLAACVGLGLFSFCLYSESVRVTLTRGWQPDLLAEVARGWAVPIALSIPVLVLVVFLAGRQLVVTVNWYIVLGCVLCLWVTTTTDRTPEIVRQQIEMQKNIESARLNHKLYDFFAGEHISGKIATDYWVLGRLPELKKHYKAQFFPMDSSVEFLGRVAAAPGVCYVLILEEELGAAARDALARGLYRTVFIEERRRFIKTCGEPAAPKVP
jgi:hypothetical protein